MTTVLLAAPLPYVTLQGVVQCLALAKAETLHEKMRPYMDEAGFADPQEARVPCDVLRAATHRLRKWRAADPETVTRLWDDSDDAELTAAWRDGLNAIE
ncbi:hypothetical protein ACH4U7_12890 [Streptomyces sp. NPDC020845]|uniref:hypothetical protein n=1 Tax=Streptomyces sp. NPDC020845 TaxID=3365096 RepID=UPI0037A2EC87